MPHDQDLWRKVIAPPTVDLNRHVDVGDIFIVSSLAAILSF